MITNQISICCILLGTAVVCSSRKSRGNLLWQSCFYQGRNIMLSKFLCSAALWNWAQSLTLVQTVHSWQFWRYFLLLGIVFLPHTCPSPSLWFRQYTLGSSECTFCCWGSCFFRTHAPVLHIGSDSTLLAVLEVLSAAGDRVSSAHMPQFLTLVQTVHSWQFWMYFLLLGIVFLPHTCPSPWLWFRQYTLGSSEGTFCSWGSCFFHTHAPYLWNCLL